MATQRIKDLAVRTGTYTDSNGEQKGRYENIGSLFKKDDGNLFMTIKATFNPAGIEREPGKDSIRRHGGAMPRGLDDPGAPCRPHPEG